MLELVCNKVVGHRVVMPWLHTNSDLKKQDSLHSSSIRHNHVFQVRQPAQILSRFTKRQCYAILDYAESYDPSAVDVFSVAGAEEGPGTATTVSVLEAGSCGVCSPSKGLLPQTTKTL